MNSNLYRKYRPKDFGDIIGQPHVVKYFHNALKKGKSLMHTFFLDLEEQEKQLLREF